jgi:hypothetical protein
VELCLEIHFGDTLHDIIVYVPVLYLFFKSEFFLEFYYVITFPCPNWLRNELNINSIQDQCSITDCFADTRITIKQPQSSLRWQHILRALEVLQVMIHEIQI